MRMSVLIVAACVFAAGVTQAQTGAPSVRPRIRQTAILKASNPEANDHFGNGGTLGQNLGAR